MSDDEVRDALRRHWAASDTNDFETEHEIYRDDAVLEYRNRRAHPQPAQHPGIARSAAEPEEIHRPQSAGWRRSVDQRNRPNLRRATVLRRQHHGIRGRESGPRDAVLRRTFRAGSIPRSVGGALIYWWYSGDTIWHGHDTSVARGPGSRVAGVAEADGISKQEAACRAIVDAAARRTHDARIRELSGQGRTRYSDLLDRLLR